VVLAGGGGDALMDTAAGSRADAFGRSGREAAMIRQLGGIGAAITPLVPPRLEVVLEGLTFEVETYEDLFVLLEVFDDRTYGLALPAPAIVIDIGAHMGITSLFFASKPWVRHVYAFEPLAPTAALARATLARNPSWQHKVTLFDYGLGARDETIEVEYAPAWKANAGRNGLPGYLPRAGATWRERIRLREAAPAVAGILDAAGGATAVVKMDFEGAEWDILPNLADAGVLERIGALAVEWHHRTPEPLERLLSDRGFALRRRPAPGTIPLGMIYATRDPRWIAPLPETTAGC